MGFLQQDLLNSWLPTFEYDYFLWNQIPTPYYSLIMTSLVSETPSSVNNNYISIQPQEADYIFMHDRNPNGRLYNVYTKNVAWNHRTTYQNSVTEGINQWVEVNYVVIHQNEIIPKYGDILSNPWDNWRYFMITNIEPWLMESMYKCDIERVNYNLNIVSINSTVSPAQQIFIQQ